MKRFFIVLIGVCFVVVLRAQQDPMFTQYMFNTLSINPAYAGSADAKVFKLIHRSQWVGFEGAPTTQTFTFHTPLSKESIGLGASVVNDSHGPVKQTGFYADASYRIIFDNAKLAFGLKAGMNLYSADLLDLHPFTGDDAAFASNISSKGLPNFGFGMMYYSRRWYIGLSSPKLLQNKLIDGDLPDFKDNQENRHMFLIAGAVFDISNYTKFKPTILVKAVNGAPPGFDVTANFLFYEKLWIGAMYRHEDAAGILLQYEINNKWKFGYSYDYTLSNLNKYSSGSHELMLGVDIGRKVGGDVSPRYF